ncbi:hypothetical protein FMUND_12757 [Fusarium mundagurra]|uniref:Uncharacterized protein n=1 Tax=Fusarium mundagurra TaxID=1567541 RepID=A0A8H5Y1C3_9HYPO|nr:hypothetical protein FMUND_12757 [Fusarium mundagurra]
MLPKHHYPSPFPPEDPVIRAADLMAVIRDNLIEHPMSTARPHLAMLPMYHYPPPLPPPPENPEMRAAHLQATMRDDLVDHYRRPSFKILSCQIYIYIYIKELHDERHVQIVKDADEQIHVPSPARKRRMSASAVTAALHGLDIGQLKENQDNHITFNIKAQSTGWLHLLLGVDGQLLPGFHAGTIARLGVGPCAGLVVRLEIIVGKFRQPHMHFKFGIRNGGRPVIFMDLIVPLDYLVDAITLNSINADDTNSLAPLRMFNAIDISELANHVKGSDVLGEKLEDLDMSNPVNHIHLVAEKVPHLRIDIDRSEVFVIDNLEFKRNLKMHPSAMQDIASAVASQFRKKGKGFLEAWFIQEESFDRCWPDILADVTQFSKPYADYLVDTRYGYADLTFGNLGHIDPDDRPDRPNKAVTFFIGAEHRTVAFITSAAEEQEMQEKRASTLLDTPIRAVVWRDEFSSWKPKYNDLEVYDIFFTIFHITSR